MEKHLTIVTTRKNWIAGNVEANFRNYERFTTKKQAVKDLPTLCDADFEPLGVRCDGEWVHIEAEGTH